MVRAAVRAREGEEKSERQSMMKRKDERKQVEERDFRRLTVEKFGNFEAQISSHKGRSVRRYRQCR